MKLPKLAYNSRIFLLLFSCIIMLISCKSNSQDCLVGYSQFGSYDEIKKYVIDNYSCKSESPNSSWIEKLKYCGCDNDMGYLIMITKNKTYLHKPISQDVWQQLINADDVGSYYTRKIKGKYKINRSR